MRLNTDGKANKHFKSRLKIRANNWGSQEKTRQWKEENILKENKMLSYRRETALQGVLQFSPKVEDWNWETIFYGHYRSIFNHNRPENLSNSVKKNANKDYYGVQGHLRSST